MHSVEDLDGMNDIDWVEEIHRKLMKSISKSHRDPSKVTGCTSVLPTYLVKPKKNRKIPRFPKWSVSDLGHALHCLNCSSQTYKVFCRNKRNRRNRKKLLQNSGASQQMDSRALMNSRASQQLDSRAFFPFDFDFDFLEKSHQNSRASH